MVKVSKAKHREDISDRALTDQIFSLRDENLELKKKLANSDDNAKK